MLLWEEYATGNPLAYKYTSFCIKYRAFAQSQQRSMRQIHIAGEKLFVDYAGSTVAIIEATTGEITQAQIFVATLGASNYTFACATARQTTADWIGAQVLALEFIGGVPRLIVPDQTRALIKTPDRYDPEPNRTYEEFARHYGCAVLAARPAHPRDKPKVEGSVLLVQRWILARLRNRRFFSLGELNAAIAQLLVELNQRPFKKLPGCRRSAFERLDAPALRPLPASRYAIGRWKVVKVNIDYHVEFEGHYYSVPHRWVGARLDVRVTGTVLECFASNQRVAGHAGERRARGLHHDGRAHAGVAPRASGVDAGQAHRLGAAHRREHRCGRHLAASTPPASRAGLPGLPGSAGPGAPLFGRAAGSGLHAGHGDPRAQPQKRHQHPQVRPGPPAFVVHRRGQPRHRARQRARARLLTETTDPQPTKEQPRC